MEREQSPVKIARSRWAQRGIAAGVGFVGLVTLLMVLAPLAGASSPTSWAPPYTGFTSTTSNSLYSSGCTAYAHESSAPAWSAATGTFSMAGKVSAGSCASGYSYASVYGQTSIVSPTFYRTHSGYSWLYLTWNLSVVAKAALSVAASTGNYSYAGASVWGYVDAYLMDVTNGSYLSSASATPFGASFTSPGHYTLSTTASTSYMYLWGALHKGHQYQVLITVYVGVSVYVYNVSATASASLNLAGPHGLTLTGITLY
jgi:hypothetical protein